MSVSKETLPKKNHGKVIDLKPESISKPQKKPGKSLPVVDAAESFPPPLRAKNPKSNRLLREQSEFQTRVDAALSQIPDILKDLREAEHGIITRITAVQSEQHQSAQRLSEELKRLHEATKIAAQRNSRSVMVAFWVIVIALCFGIYFIYDSKTSSQLILQKISGIETTINQNTVKAELLETRRTLTDALRVNQQRIGENQKTTQSLAKEIQKLDKIITNLYDIERLNTNTR